ncbi:MAG: GAF domain-containing protein [Ramlibacter sp.]|nr:GAF domain-containing protein [Ramlibacter sp.]
MIPAPIPAQEGLRLAAVRAAVCAYAPREERFDRITRTAKRLLQVPIALITIVEEDEQWFRSVQGLDEPHTPRDISFCGHVVASGKPLVIRDTWTDNAFADNPLVLGKPGIRSYVGLPLEIAPGIFAGSLCAIDTMPRTYDEEELAALQDLARMAESELRSVAVASLQKSLLMRLDLAQRRQALDPVTGCWTIRGFRELLGLAVEQAHADNTQMALCLLRVNTDAAALKLPHGDSGRTLMLGWLAQLLRGRLPPEGALARLGDTDFCALLSAPTALALERVLSPVVQPELSALLAHGQSFQARVDSHVVHLDDLGGAATGNTMWARILAALQPGKKWA